MLPAFLPVPAILSGIKLVSGKIPWKAVGIGLAGAGLALVIFLAYKHYTGLVDENKTLTANNAALELSVKTQADTIGAQADALAEWSTAQQELIRAADELQRAATAARAETRRLNDIFARHDLESLALARPGLIENRINAGTSDASRLLECASGAERDDCPGADRETD